MRDYGKIHSSFWTSDDLRGLSDTGRLLASYLLTSPHTNQIGCFRLPDGYVCDDLNWPSERVREGFDELSNKGFAAREDATKWVLIYKFLKWNQIENPNQAKSAEKQFDQVPAACSLRTPLAVAFAEFSRFPVLTAKPLHKGSPTLAEPSQEPFLEPFRNQEQEQEQEQEMEQEQEQEKEQRASADAPPFKFTMAKFPEFWAAYPDKTGKGAAEKAFAKVSKSRDVEFADLMAGLERYKQLKPEWKAWCNPATWLNQKRWGDDHAEQPIRAGPKWAQTA